MAYIYFIILKNKLLAPKDDALYNKEIFNRKVYSAEINQRKKHIKIKNLEIFSNYAVKYH